MAYDSTTRNSQYDAMAILDKIRNIYRDCKSAQASLNLYQAGTDPTFNAAINALHPPAERTELGQMLTQINALVADFEQNHATAIGL